jgi:paraquat-inducible protein A
LAWGIIILNFRFIYLLLVIVGVVIFVCSIFSPLLSISEFYIFTNTLSIKSALLTLLRQDEWLLFIVILCFTIVLPGIKYMLLIIGGIKPKLLSKHSFRMLEAISKWAMLDVFIVAVVIASVKLKVFASAETHYGLYMFVSSVLLSIICASIQNHLIVRD